MLEVHELFLHQIHVRAMVEGKNTGILIALIASVHGVWIRIIVDRVSKEIDTARSSTKVCISKGMIHGTRIFHCLTREPASWVDEPGSDRGFFNVVNVYLQYVQIFGHNRLLKDTTHGLTNVMFPKCYQLMARIPCFVQYGVAFTHTLIIIMLIFVLIPGSGVAKPLTVNLKQHTTTSPEVISCIPTIISVICSIST
jgi:hypothetical protein